ncbi:hypothetical protein HPB50_018921 [Hyalomma asiaticum]|uniref:Uncharacterized protein n=1 Tax=Hyalomma asiaticum TaxID=266040 RepID=A0ACB7TN43_HYAAI|nr:hypothetical protein HPB50_018921 [Hyalomma asiaticum]
MSEFQDLFMLSDVVVQNQEPTANAETMFGLSDSVNFGSSMRNGQDAAATAWAGIRPDTACTTPRNPSTRDTNETRRPQDVSALAADVAESTGNSVPSNEVLLQNALLVMQSLAGALQNNAQAAPQMRRVNASATFADEQVPRGWEPSDHALDPYAYALRMAHDSPVCDAPRQEREADTRPGVRHATERSSYDPPVRGEQRPGRHGFSGRCYQCGAMGHIARECRRTPVQEQTRGSGNGRGRRSVAAAAKPPAKYSTNAARVSPAQNAAAAPPQHHLDSRSPRIPPAWTSRLCSLHPILQAAATRTCPPGYAKEEASPAGSEEPRPNEAALVIMHRAARDQGFVNGLLQVATNNRSGGAHEGATSTTGLPKPATKMAAIPEPAATTAPAAASEPGATTAATTARTASATAAGATEEAATTVPAVATEAAAMQVGLPATPMAEPTEVQEDMARDTSSILLLEDDVRFTRRAVSVVGGPS